jgi:hypothetical protein
MPYINENDRRELDPSSALDDTRRAESAGELNFQITKLVIEYVEHNGLGYAAINDVLGALEGAKLEFYRRVAVPYEEFKVFANGDVYPPSLVKAKVRVRQYDGTV